MAIILDFEKPFVDQLRIPVLVVRLRLQLFIALIVVNCTYDFCKFIMEVLEVKKINSLTEKKTIICPTYSVFISIG